MQSGHAADDPRRTVEVAAMVNGVHVRAHDDPRRAAVTAGQSRVLVAGVVVGDLQRQLARPLGDEPMREVLAVTVGGAGDPGGIRRVLVQTLEDLLRLHDLGWPDHAFVFSQGRMDSAPRLRGDRLRGNDVSSVFAVIPTKAGIH